MFAVEGTLEHLVQWCSNDLGQRSCSSEQILSSIKKWKPANKIRRKKIVALPWLTSRCGLRPLCLTVLEAPHSRTPRLHGTGPEPYYPWCQFPSCTHADSIKTGFLSLLSFKNAAYITRARRIAMHNSGWKAVQDPLVLKCINACLT